MKGIIIGFKKDSTISTGLFNRGAGMSYMSMHNALTSPFTVNEEPPALQTSRATKTLFFPSISKLIVTGENTEMISEMTTRRPAVLMTTKIYHLLLNVNVKL